jgi:hypothetical protein
MLPVWHADEHGINTAITARFILTTIILYYFLSSLCFRNDEVLP